MAQVAVQCPECGRLFVVNGRGACTCGAYLIHHIGRGKGKVIDRTLARPIWDVSGPEPVRIYPSERYKRMDQ